MTLLSFRPRLDPFEDMLRLQEELERFLSKPALDLGLSGRGVFPPVNVFGDRQGIVVRAEIPGVVPDSIELSIERRVLTIRGERKEDPRPQGSYHRRERRFGAFSRSVQLPEDLDGSKAAAECRNGLLTVRIPRTEEARPRSIKIEAS